MNSSCSRLRSKAERKSRTRLPLSDPNLFTEEPASHATTLPRIKADRAVEDLKLNPAFVRTDLLPSPGKLAEMEEMRDRLFQEPIVITHKDIIIDGHARWIIAKKRAMKVLTCVVCRLATLL